MISFKEVTYVESINIADHIVLAGDIGGTNSNFGVCSIENGNVTLLFSLHTKSQEIKDFPLLVDQVVQHARSKHGVELTRACFAAAGVVSEKQDRCKPTNLNVVIDAHAIIEKTELTSVVLINDFEAVGYGVDHIDPKDIIQIHKGEQRNSSTKGIIGAGTGLGKGMLGWNEALKTHVPIPSEGGHADFPVYSLEELKLVQYIQMMLGTDKPISWEHVLSGSGIVHMYNFLKESRDYEETEVTRQIVSNNHHPDQIFKYWQEDKLCGDTFNWYALFYARCAKDFALESLALGGLYIAGGIASKNIALFSQPGFMKQFTASIKQEQLLQSIPICAIADYNVSLYGAAAYLTIHR